jgi:hypothetical protein
MRGFNVTYEIVTEESAENGDVESNGVLAENVSLREAAQILGETESPHCSLEMIEASEYPVRFPRWVTAYNSADYITGITENRHLHFPESATGSSRRRVCRLLRVYGCK